MKTPWIFVGMGNDVRLYQSNSGIERRFQNRGQITSGGTFLKLLLTIETFWNIVQDKVNLIWILLEKSVFSVWILLEYSLNFMFKTSTDYVIICCVALGIYGFDPRWFFVSAEDPRSQIQELENELELQQQQIKDLQSKLEQEGKVRAMLVLRLADEQRARLATVVSYPGYQRFFLARGGNTFSAEGRTHERRSRETETKGSLSNDNDNAAKQ